MRHRTGDRLKTAAVLALVLAAVALQAEPTKSAVTPVPSPARLVPSSEDSRAPRPTPDRELQVRIDYLEKADARLQLFLAIFSIGVAAALALPPFIFIVIGVWSRHWAKQKIESEIRAQTQRMEAAIRTETESQYFDLRGRLAGVQALTLGDSCVKDGKAIDDKSVTLESAINAANAALALLEKSERSPQVAGMVRNGLAYFYAVGRKTESGKKALELVTLARQSESETQSLYFVDTEARVLSEFSHCVNEPERELTRIKGVLEDLLNRQTVSEERKAVYRRTLESHVVPAIQKLRTPSPRNSGGGSNRGPAPS